VDSVDIARYLVPLLAEYYPKAFAERFRIDDISDPNPDVVLERIAHRRGCLTKGVGADMIKVSELVIHELRAGSIGRISLESPADNRGYVASLPVISDGLDPEQPD
jgi:ribosome biogenesis GTPase A